MVGGINHLPVQYGICLRNRGPSSEPSCAGSVTVKPVVLARSGINRRVIGLRTSATTPDLTGQIIWPVSVLLSWYIVTHPHLFRDRVVLEIGSGSEAQVANFQPTLWILIGMVRRLWSAGARVGAVLQTQRLD